MRALLLPSACIVVMLASAMYVPISNRLGVPVTEMRNVYVLETVGAFSYWLQDEHGQKIFATFCDSLGYEPPFDRGEVILTLRFRNVGTCWDMRDLHPKYVMKREANGNVTRED